MPESDSRVARIDPGSGQKVEQPVLVILKQMLPVYQQLCSKCCHDVTQLFTTCHVLSSVQQ